MANMHEIRDRIKSINDIMKITNAMYLIKRMAFVAKPES